MKEGFDLVIEGLFYQIIREENDNMIVGRFNQKLMEYDDEFILNVYEEIQILDETGAFPPNHKYFRELADIRSKLYNTQYNVDATRKDILEEIARRWYFENKQIK